VGLYLLNLLVVAAIYAKAAPRGFRALWLGLLCTSKRVHSIFMLRLFNDGPTMLTLHLAVLLREKEIGGSGGSLEPPGPLLRTRLATRLNPVAE
jgi:hypothetical protein